jgi:hypothetical protein
MGQGWWTLDITGVDELNDGDREHVAAQILAGFTSGQVLQSEPTCKKCGTHIAMNGFCMDITCPYSDWNQEIPRDLLEKDLTTLDIFTLCKDKNIPVRINDEELRASNDLFECVECEETFDNEESVSTVKGLICEGCWAINKKE